MNTRSRRHARMTVKCASAVAGTVASVVLVGCGSDEPASKTASPDAVDTTDPATSAATPTASSTAPTSEDTVASPLEGAWQAGPVSLEQSEATIRRHGFGRWVEDYRANAPFSGDTVLTLTIENGAWDLYGESDGGAPEPIDYNAEYEIRGDTVVFHHSDGSNTYRWAVDGDTLRLHFVKTTFPLVPGQTPEEVYQRALYMTEAFTKQG
jgi:hypothetical protein